MFIMIIIITLIIILMYNNNKLKKENESLKIKNNNTTMFCPKCGVNILRGIRFCPKCGHNFNQAPPGNVYQQTSVNITKVKHTDKEIKNTLILTVGAILIIISAIAFLISTWNATGNFVKTLILLLMLIVFFSVSYIADKRLNLKQTSKTFYYVAFAYLPIIFLSIAMFGLFGNYLSLNGEGKYIYLTISSVIIALIYYLDCKRTNSKALFIFNIIFQLLSIKFFVSAFTNKFNILLFVMLIYSIVICVLYLIKKIYFNEKAHKILSITLSFSISTILVLINLLNCLFNNIFIIDVVSCILMLINLYLILVKLLNKHNIYKLIYPIIIILTFNNLTFLFKENVMFGQALILISFAISFMYNIFEEKKVNISTYIEILIGFIFFYFFWLVASTFNDNMMPTYILFGVMTVLSLVYYVFDEENKIFSSIMLATGTVATTIATVTYFDFDVIILSIVSFILIIISMFKNIHIGLKTGFKWIGLISLILISTIFVFATNIYSLILYFVYAIVIITYGIIKKENVYKIFSYIFINIVLFNIFEYLQIDYSSFIMPTTTIVLTFIERIFNNIRSKASDIYLILSYILSVVILLDTTVNYNNIVMLLLSSSFIYYIICYKKSKNYLYIPFMGMIPHIYFDYDLIINNFNIMYIVSILFIILLGYLIYNKKNNIYIVMFYVYNFFHLTCLEDIKYVSIFLLIAGSFICYLIKNNKIKEFYKALIYILWLILYNTILSDLMINLTSVSAMSYLILLILITRTIIKKYSNSYKIWEYIISILINLIVMCNFTSEYDGILYFVFLAILIIISYIYKLGPIFLISLISIIINSIILTQVIFGNIPWWLYILIIGGILIGFAIYNESKENKQDEKSIKKHLDL